MGFFRNNTKRLIQQFKAKSEYYFNDLGKDIKEQLEDLKSDYEENSSVIPEYLEFVNVLKVKLDNKDAQKLEEFSKRLAKVNRNARNGVEALWELSYNQRKITAENLREYEEFE
ncbi:MAG TPA: hypothetical protein VK623_11305 [Flavobacterium sp.]|nr:hypothetical protein [Flavobacterium sp.]